MCDINLNRSCFVDVVSLRQPFSEMILTVDEGFSNNLSVNWRALIHGFPSPAVVACRCIGNI